MTECDVWNVNFIKTNMEYDLTTKLAANSWMSKNKEMIDDQLMNKNQHEILLFQQ